MLSIALLVAPSQLAFAEDPAAASGSMEDRINYSIGYELGGYLTGLEDGASGVDLASVLKGILDALTGAEPVVSTAERRELLDRLRPATAAAEKQPAFGSSAIPARERGFMDDFAALNARREGVVSLPSGVQYEVLTAGSGPQPVPGDSVAIRYEGKLTTGVVFDTTYDDGEALRLAVDSIAVPGLREALLLMRAGDKWRVVIPPSMGFGRIGNNQLRKRDLIYEVELVSVASTAERAPPSGASAEGPEPGQQPAEVRPQ